MDTLAHGLWAVAAAKTANSVAQKKIRTGWVLFWGVMPDLSSFTPAICWMLWLVLVKGVPYSQVPRPELLPPEVRAKFFIFRLTNALYHPTHSLNNFCLRVFPGLGRALVPAQLLPRREITCGCSHTRNTALGNVWLAAAHPD